MQPDHWFGRLSHAMRDHEGARVRTDLLPPRYDILGDPKAGGMGVVYRAWDRDLGREVAIKVLLQGPESLVQSVARLRREAELAARLTHPNIVAVHDLGTWKDSGRPYIVMQYIDGASLNHAKIRDFRELARTMAKAARAAASVHDRGVLHRDLKPQNILVDRSGHVYLTDFGLALDARAAAEGTKEIVGTPAFMSPEQAAGLPIDARSDVYALGATLYSQVTGNPPARGSTTEELLADVIRGIPPPVRKLRPDCPEPLERIIGKALSKRKEDRYPTALALAEALEGFRRMSLLRRHPWAAAWVAAAVLGGLLWVVQARVEQQRQVEREGLAEIHRLVGLEQFQEADRKLSVLRSMLGERDERLGSREEELRSRKSIALERESLILFGHLWGDDPESAHATRERLIRIDPDLGKARIREVEAAVDREKKQAGVVGTRLDLHRYREALDAIRSLRGSRYGEIAFRSIQTRLRQGLLLQIGRPPKQPGDPAPIVGIRDALALLRELAPDTDVLPAFEKGLDLGEHYRKAEAPGIDSRGMLALLVKMREIDPGSPYTIAVEDLLRVKETLEEAHLSLEGKLKAWESDGLDLFKGRSLTALSDLVLRVKDVAGRNPESSAPRVLQELTEALRWLRALDQVWDSALETPEGAQRMFELVVTDPLSGAWKEAALTLKAQLGTRIRLAMARKAILELDTAVLRGDLALSRQALGKIEPFGGPELDQARAKVRALEAALKTLGDGRQSLGEGRVTDALHLTLQAAPSMPQNPAIPELILRCLERLAKSGDPQQFLSEYGYLSLQGILDEPGLRKQATQVLERIAGRLTDPAAAWKAALLPVERVLQTDPSRTDVRLEKAGLLRSLGQYSAVHELLSGILEKTPQDPKAIALRGQVRFLERSWKPALDDFDQVLREEPGNRSVLYWHALTLCRLNRLDEARSELQRTIDQGLAGGDVSYELAWCLYEAKDWDGALSSIAAAEHQEGVLSEEGRISRGSESVPEEEVLRLFRRDLRILKANIFFKQENWKECVKACDQALALDPSVARAHLLRGWVAFKEDRITDALPDLEKAMKLSEQAHDDFGQKEATLLHHRCLERKGR